MTRAAIRAWSATVALVLVPATAAAATAQAAQAAATGRITVDVQGIASSKGNVLVGLFLDSNGFPDRAAKAFARRAQKARAGSLRFVFERVPPRPFAVSVLHDENGDFAMNTGLFGIPSEGYGFSRDAHGMFGPPDFAAARIALAPGEQKTIRIRLRY